MTDYHNTHLAAIRAADSDDALVAAWAAAVAAAPDTDHIEALASAADEEAP
jgi:hypothetical protein